MKLSLSEACRLLGQTPRQVRYRIKSGTLKAFKQGGHWVIDDADLPLSDGQRQAAERRAVDLRTEVEAALGPALRRGRAYTVRDVRAFERGVALCRAAGEILGDHAATRALNSSVVLIAQGCHRFHGRDKAGAFREARERAAEAVAHLHVHGDARAVAVADGLEHDYLPVVAGLVRRYERRAQPQP